MRLTLRFEFLSTDELVMLLKQASTALKWDVQPEVLPAIASRSRGTQRIALRFRRRLFVNVGGSGAQFETGIGAALGTGRSDSALPPSSGRTRIR